MTRLYFNAKEARDFLIERGFVYTLRRARNRYFEPIVATYYDSNLKQTIEIGRVKMNKIKDVTKKEDVVEYLKYSGFNELDTWWNTALYLNGNDLILYEVKV